jgi:protein-disulfide isomerase
MRSVTKTLVSLCLLGAAAAPALAQSDKEVLFKYKGKAVTGADLAPSEQQALYDLRAENYTRLEQLVNHAVVDRYLTDEAARTGKTKAEVDQALFATKEPTDAEVKTWFDANQGRLPPEYKLEQVAPEIKKFLKVEQARKQRDELIAKLKKDGVLTTSLAEPAPPAFKIDTLGYPARGGAKAKVTLVEFADYQCPHCKAAKPTIEKVVKARDGVVSFVFMDFPINQSGISRLVAQGAFCAEKQGKYWEYHDLAYEQQKTLDNDAPRKLAETLKLDAAAFKACFDSEAPKERVAKAQAEAERLGVTGTPTLFINGKRVKDYGEEELLKAVDQAAKGGAT